MKGLKNFWKYFTITILLLFALACAGVLYMFFVGAPLFNVKYISFNKNYVSSEYNMSTSGQEFNTVELNSGKYEVKILDSANENVYLKMHNGAFGFAKKSNSTFDFDEKVEGGVLTFDVSEPHGFVATGSSVIKLYLPVGARLNLILSNSRAATTYATTAEVENLSYSTTAGNFKFNSGKVNGALNLSLGRATFSVAEAVETNANVVNLKMTSGCFNCPKKDFGTINLISSTSGIVRANSASEMIGNNANAGGSITISSLGNANLTAGDTNIKINTLTSGVIEIGKTGKVNVEKIIGRVNLHTDGGNISVGESHFELTCTSQSGNISVAKAFKVVNAETSSGNISVNFDFAENLGAAEGTNYTTTNSYAQNKDNRRFIAQTKTGNITATGVENVDILITENGHASVYFENVLGNNVIKAEKSGSVYVQVKEFKKEIAPEGWAHFNLETHSSAASLVRVNFTQMGETEGQHEQNISTDINPNATQDEKNNSLTVETDKGSLTVLDSITATI